MKIAPAIIIPAAALWAVAGCAPLSVAGLALDLIQPGQGASMFRNPYDQPAGEGLQEALGRMQDEPDPRCLRALDAQTQDSTDSAAAAATPAPEADAPSKAARPGVQLVCLPGNTKPIALVLRVASPAAAPPPPTGNSPAWAFTSPAVPAAQPE